MALLALPRERREFSRIRDFADGLGTKDPIESHQEFRDCPKPSQGAQNVEAADAGHIDGSKKALADGEKAHPNRYHGPNAECNIGSDVKSRLEGWNWAKQVRSSPELTDGDKVVAWDLLDRLNWQTMRLDPAVETVARGSARRARAVQRSIAALVTEGFLRKAEASAGRKTNAYRLTFPTAATSATPSCKTGLAADVLVSTTSHATGLRSSEVSTTPSNETANPVRADTQTLENLSVPTPVSPSPTDPFESFWLIWGRHEDKGKARLQWQRAISRLAVDPERIIEAARAYRLARTGKGREAWETPALWLRREGYADDEPRKPSTPPASKSQVFLAEGSDGLKAWDEYRKQSTGTRIGYPRTCHQGKDGWWFPTPLPPSSVRQAA